MSGMGPRRVTEHDGTGGDDRMTGKRRTAKDIKKTGQGSELRTVNSSLLHCMDFSPRTAVEDSSCSFILSRTIVAGDTSFAACL